MSLGEGHTKSGVSSCREAATFRLRRAISVVRLEVARRGLHTRHIVEFFSFPEHRLEPLELPHLAALDLVFPNSGSSSPHVCFLRRTSPGLSGKNLPPKPFKMVNPWLPHHFGASSPNFGL